MPVLRQCHGVQAIYVGSDLTADGNTIFARSEDIANSYNRLFCVSPAGRHTAGEEYAGCYGFTYTVTRDSYFYTAFSGDNGDAAGDVCPDCGSDHPHTLYEAGGANEMGVTVSATETIWSPTSSKSPPRQARRATGRMLRGLRPAQRRRGQRRNRHRRQQRSGRQGSRRLRGAGQQCEIK